MGGAEVWIALLLVLVANGAPVLAQRAFPQWLARPIDAGRMWRGRPLLGPSKTWRGVSSSLVVTAVVAEMLALPLTAGVAAALAAMVGDIFSSFMKRRLGMRSSDMAVGLDQVPESLLPAIALMPWLPLNPFEVVAVVFLFIVLELVLSRLLFELGIRKRPY